MSLSLDAPTTLEHLVQTVLAEVPPLRDEMVDARGAVLPHIHVFVNGRDYVHLPKGIQTVLHATDRVDIFPPTAGGC